MRCFAATLLVLALTSATLAKGPYTDPKNTDDDFPIQGEYTGTVKTDNGDIKIGVQVIAMGKGKFQAVGYHGGLPGDGWDKETPYRSDAEKADDGSVTFEGKDGKGKGVLKDDVIVVFAPNGNEVTKLEKIHRKSPTLGKEPPKDAVVLFDGSDVAHWKNGKMSDDKLLMQGTTSKDTFGSHHLHIEFRLPYQPEARGQGRGNSGVYIQGRYECQMLDSFGLEGKQNECGGLYSVKAPDLNMCLPPLSWQTYDIDYTAAKYDGDKLVENPRVTIKHNGVVIHDDVELPGNRNTTAAPSKAGPGKGPVYLQNHGNPVRYRNIWVVEK